MSKILNWVAKQNWWIVALGVFFIWFWETIEAIFPQLHYLFDIKLLFYLVMFLFIGWILDSSSRKLKTQSKTMKILDFKHDLSQEFSICTEWEVLIDYMVRLPGMIAAIEQTYLFVANPLSKQFECVAQWNDIDHHVIDLNSVGISRKYLDENLRNGLKFGRCEGLSVDEVASPLGQTFCLPIQYGEGLNGILQFRLKKGRTLTLDQTEIFENIGDEIAIALKIGQERNAFNEMLRARIALGERRTISHYLHDHLSQNLGYVHFKLGQLISELDKLTPGKMLSDLEHMRDAASESYDIIRGTLEKINLETTPVLTNLLSEYAREVARRAHFEIDFKAVGRPIPVDVNIQRAVYYVFQEALSNIERHAKASKVNVVAKWNNDHFELSIHDNGIGFNPKTVNANQHFGLEIMRERMAKVKGHVKLTISENSGTLVNFSIPTPPVRELRVDNE